MSRTLRVVLGALLLAGAAWFVVAWLGRYVPPDPLPPPLDWARVSERQITEAERLGVPVAFENEFGMRFVLIPSGTFLMGSPPDEEGRADNEGPRHEVTFAEPFYLQFREATYEELDAAMGETVFRHRSGAAAYTSWGTTSELVWRLNLRDPRRGYRLPTEAEWEYACRAGTTTRYWSGDSEDDLHDVGHVSRGEGGEKPPNPWGLYDMHGGLLEACADDWHGSYEGAPTDGSAWLEGSNRVRVCRGGSDMHMANEARSAHRTRGPLNSVGHGIRLARSVASMREPPPEPPPGPTYVPLPAPLDWARVSFEQVAEAKKLGISVAFENKLGMRFVLIPGGSFSMGSPADERGRQGNEGPQHEVAVPPFYLAVTEVTNAQYLQFRPKHYKKAVPFWERDDLRGNDQPVGAVGHYPATAFLRWLSEREGGVPYRLPSEAEWEYACRAGTPTRYWSGDAEGDLWRVGWYGRNTRVGTGIEGATGPKPVGTKPPSPWGLYDMHGSVWEGCEDDWHDSYEGAPLDGGAWVDQGPRPEPHNELHVCRGGSWYSGRERARSAWRWPWHTPQAEKDMGFRVARSVVKD